MSGKKKARKFEQMEVVWAVLIALLLGAIIGNLYANTYGELDSALNDATDDSDTGHAHAGTFDLDPASDAIPSVKVLADADAKGGWNITLVTSNFEFTPQDVNGEDAAGTGHAHLWIDGEKIGRLYGTNHYVGALGAGDHEITVTLNSNTHKDYAVDGETIKSTINVTEVDEDAEIHEHEDGELHVHE